MQRNCLIVRSAISLWTFIVSVGAKNVATRKRATVNIKPCGAQLGTVRRAKHTRQGRGLTSPTLKNSAADRIASQGVAACFNVGRRMVLRYEVSLVVSHERGGARTMKIEKGKGRGQ